MMSSTIYSAQQAQIMPGSQPLASNTSSILINTGTVYKTMPTVTASPLLVDETIESISLLVV